MEITATIDLDIRTRFQELLNGLCQGLYEREESVKLSLLTAIAGESIFLLGPPGVGKSLIARRLKHAFLDGTSFEYLMSKFSTPDEVFGPISIKKLKEEDKYERLTDRYLPGANIIFLDEIWKAGPAIQNALLTILNEKIYRNGDQDMKVNIRGIITASNELPLQNKNLAPIWDRFLVRLELGNIKTFNNFVQMITNTEDVYEDTISEEVKLKENELQKWSTAIDEIEVPAEVLNTIQLVKYKLEEHNAKPNNADKRILIHDRRWKKLVRLMRTSAFLNGREKVDLMDCFLMLHCLWNTPIQKEIIRDLVVDAVRKHGYSMAVNLQTLKKEVADFEADVNKEIKVRHKVVEEQLMPIEEEYYELLKESHQFEGKHVTIKQYRQLNASETSVTNFYDENLSLVNRLRAKKGAQQHVIEVQFNDALLSFGLKTVQQERTEVIFKKPHPIVLKYWEERHEKLMHYITQQEGKVRYHAPDELNHLEQNIFVDKKWSEVVQSNMQEVKEALQALKLRLEKLRYSYLSIDN
ncbi:MAG: AAA family ATPase [Bacteroidota bacterium]